MTSVLIVETKTFTARITSLLDDDEYLALQLEMLQRPGAGAVIPGTGGLRKLRWGFSGQGERGGVRFLVTGT